MRSAGPGGVRWASPLCACCPSARLVAPAPSAPVQPGAWTIPPSYLLDAMLGRDHRRRRLPSTRWFVAVRGQVRPSRVSQRSTVAVAVEASSGDGDARKQSQAHRRQHTGRHVGIAMGAAGARAPLARVLLLARVDPLAAGDQGAGAGQAVIVRPPAGAGPAGLARLAAAAASRSAEPCRGRPAARLPHRRASHRPPAAATAAGPPLAASPAPTQLASSRPASRNAAHPTRQPASQPPTHPASHRSPPTYL